MAALYRAGTRWQELLECSPDLEALGITPDRPLKEAQAQVPGARYLPCDPAVMDAVSRAFDAVLEVLEAFSPAVEPAPSDALSAGRALAYLDVAGLEALYGAEPQLALRLAAAASDAGGVPASVGIASSKFISLVAAGLAARFAAHERVLVVPPGEEVLFLSPLPLETLPLSLRTRGALRRLRVRTLGEFAALPANAVRHRYNAEGLAAHILATGIDPSPLRPRRSTPAWLPREE